MGGDSTRAGKNVIIPDTGAAKYWYVDQSAPGVPTAADEPFDPMQAFAPRDEGDNDTEKKYLEEALSRMGALPEGTQPSL